MQHKVRFFGFLLITLFFGANLIAQDYVGPEKCLTCHPDYTDWRNTMHANGYSVVEDDSRTLEDLFGVVADYDQNGVDDFKDGLNFNNISSVFDPFKPNAPILGYDEENGYTITIGGVTHTVYLTYGGSGYWKQRYMVKINTSEGESEAVYISPVQYNEVTDEYTDYHPEAWWDSNNEPIYTAASTLEDAASSSRSMPKECAGCHMTGTEMSKSDAGEWIASAAPVEDPDAYSTYNNVYDIDADGDLDQINTTCENSMCHGPGAEHANSPNPDNIGNPSEFTPEEQNNACGMCHNRGDSKPNNTFSFPFDDQNLTEPNLGDLVADFFTDGGVDWGDDKNSYKHRQQFLGFYESSKPTFEFHQVTCNECHNVHNNQEHQIVSQLEEEDSTGSAITVETKVDDNTLCLACHATHGDFSEIPVEWVADYDNNVDNIGAVVSEHTNHPYDPEGSGASRCVDCHMATVAKSAVPYDIHTHTFEAIAPQKTKEFEMPNSCARSCHMENGLTFGIDFSEDELTDWTESTDIALADTLMNYYGPGGKWWDVDVTDVDPVFAASTPTDFGLGQNYPNPFNPSTNIQYELPEKSNVELTIYNMLGEKVNTLVNEVHPAGTYRVQFNASNLTSGVYIYTIEAKDFVASKKMLLV